MNIKFLMLFKVQLLHNSAKYAMERVDHSYGSFEVVYQDEKHTWYLAIHPEMCPAVAGIKPTGNYFVYCIDPTYGSCCFLVEQDENCAWFCDQPPTFVTKDFVRKIGTQIESRNN